MGLTLDSPVPAEVLAEIARTIEAYGDPVFIVLPG
jgi:hypothetical protein